MRLCWIVLLCLLLHSCSAQSSLVTGSSTVVDEVTFDYYLYYPEGYEEEGTRLFPILLFLHGGGESGKELSMVKKHGPPKMMADGYPFPFLVLAPQHPEEKMWWDIHGVKKLLDEIVTQNRVDKDRIYLTGLSRGGSAAWDLAVNYPETFAALAVVCGMAPTPYAHWIDKSTPIWVFHGAKDPVIPVEESDLMVEKLKNMGYNVKYTRYDDIGHEAWIPAYENDSLYSWFIKHKK